MIETLNHYKTLGISIGASQEEIDRAYRRLARRFHHDLHPSEQREWAEEQMKRLNEAYEVLDDPKARLLYGAVTRGIAPDYARRLLATFPIAEPEQTVPSKTQAPKPELVEPLSERELEVLQLIAEGLTNQEIASRLFLALETAPGHQDRQPDPDRAKGGETSRQNFHRPHRARL